MSIDISRSYEAYYTNMFLDMKKEGKQSSEVKTNIAENRKDIFTEEKFNWEKLDITKRVVVIGSATEFSSTKADIMKDIRETKGSYDYSDVINTAGYIYAKLYADIEKRYEEHPEYYYKSDGTPATKEEEIIWLDQEYESEIAWQKSIAKIAAEREKFLGNIAEVPKEEINGIEDDFYEARKRYMDLYQEDKTALSLQDFYFSSVKSFKWL